MSLFLGLVFLAIIMGSGIRNKRNVFAISRLPLSHVDGKTVVLQLK